MSEQLAADLRSNTYTQVRVVSVTRRLDAYTFGEQSVIVQAGEVARQLVDACDGVLVNETAFIQRKHDMVSGWYEALGCRIKDASSRSRYADETYRLSKVSESATDSGTVVNLFFEMSLGVYKGSSDQHDE